MREFINVVACYSLVIGAYVFGALQTEAAFGQCYGGSCYAGSCYSGQCYGGSYYSGGYSYAPTSPRYGFRQAYSGGYATRKSCYGGYCSNGSFARSCSRGTIAGRVPGEYAPGLTCANGSCQLQTCAPCAPSASVPQAASDAFDAACKCDDCKCDDCKCGEETETIETEETTEPVKPCGPVNVRICSDGSCKLGNLIKTPIATTYLAAANAVRALRGLPPLALDPSLESGSQQHAYSMARYGGLYHAGGVAEICAQNGGVGIDGALQQWTDSPRHAAILFNPRYTRAGFANYRDRYGRNWCVGRFM